MAKYIKPDVSKVWADTGTKTKPLDSKISTGWVVEKPKFENMNWLQNRQDSYLRYLNQLGIPEWDDKTQYIAGQSYVQGTTTGNVYRCVTTHGGIGGSPQNPEADATDTYWALAFDVAGSSAEVASDLASLQEAYTNLTGVNPASARGNLSVYSVNEVDTALGKAANGDCRLALVGSDLTLLPFKGNQITISSVNRSIPNSGAVVTSSGASPDTLYYIYAYYTGGAVTLEKSTTAYATDASTGVAIKSGDSTKVLVGMARTNGSSAWALVRSYFNDDGFVSRGHLSTERMITSATFIEVNSEIRVGFLVWDKETVTLQVNGTVRTDGGSFAGPNIATSVTIDSTLQDTYTLCNAVGAGASVPVSTSFTTKSLTEGYHVATVVGKCGGITYNAYYSGSSSPAERTTLTVSSYGN